MRKANVLGVNILKRPFLFQLLTLLPIFLVRFNHGVREDQNSFSKFMFIEQDPIVFCFLLSVGFHDGQNFCRF